MMLMPTSDSALPMMGQATTVLTPTSVSTLPAVTTSIQGVQSKDTTWTKLFVGGLPYHTTDKSLREHFEVFGDIEEAVVITDRSTGKSRGYGFVIMCSKESAERACKEPNPIIDGRKANVNLAILGAKPRANIPGKVYYSDCGNNLAASIPLAALRPGFQTILPSQYGDLFSGGHIGFSPGYAGTAGGSALAQAGVPVSAASVVQATPGKARSSMNLGLISGRQAVQTAGASPYLQQLYTAGSPYMHPNIINLAGLTGADPYVNPLLDFYNQYAAAAAAGFQQMPTVTQAMVPSIQSNGLDSTNAAAMAAGGYFGYAYAPFSAQQLTAAGLSAAAGLPYAATAGPTVGGQPQQAASEARIQ